MKKQRLRLISAALAACMMTSVLPVNALALADFPGGGDSCSENGVTAQEIETRIIPLTGTEITEGGENIEYVIPEGTYTGPIVINVTDTTKPVNIAIKGEVIAQKDPFLVLIKREL